MNARTFLTFRRGYLIIEVTGKYPERFINLCLYHHIPLWHIAYLSDGFKAETTLDGYRQMRTISRKCHCIPHILAKKGWPFKMAALRRHWRLVGCVALFLLLIQVMSLSIWVIHLEGIAEEQQAAVMKTIEAAGLRPGRLKSHIDKNAIIYAIKQQHQEIIWVTFEIHGIYAQLKLVEEVPIIPKKAQTGDIIAAKNGQLSKMIVLNGTPCVSIGDIVGKNDMIVEGRIYVDDVWLKDVEAQALIEAKTWYYGFGQAGREEYILTATGESVQERVLYFKGNKITSALQKVPYELYKIKEVVYPLIWRNIVFPVEVIQREYLELEVEHRYIDHDTALEKAEAMAMSELLAQFPDTCEIVDVKSETIEEDGIIFVQVVAETIEDISSFAVHGSGRTR